jgi:hypothetical protein
MPMHTHSLALQSGHQMSIVPTSLFRSSLSFSQVHPLCASSMSAKFASMSRSTVSPILAALAILGFTSSCAPHRPPPAPLSGLYSGAGEDVYRRGYHLGFQDGKRGRDDDYEHYHYEYSESTEEAFQRGYELGYETGEDQSESDDAERDRAKNDGYNAGHSDAENGLSPFYQRHRRDYTPDTETQFRNGYVRGYNAARDDHAPVGSRRTYNDGYRQGELDAEHGRSPRPEAFTENISSANEAHYLQGYRDGFKHAVPKY